MMFNIKLKSVRQGLLLATLLYVVPDTGQAQSIKTPSTLQGYIDMAIENNLELINRQLEVEEAAAALKQASGNFFPDVDFSASYDLSGGGRTIEIPVGDLVNPINVSVNQLLGENRLPVNLENVSEPILNDEFHETKIRIVQPLFNTDIYYSYKARQTLLSVRQAFINELTKEIKVSYYHYLMADDLLKIRDSMRVLLEELLTFNQNLVKYDKATSDVVSSARFELSELESDFAETIKQRNTARSFFNFLLNRPLDTDIEIDATVSESSPYSDLGVLTQLALQNRDELLQLRSSIRAQESLLRLQRSDVLPEVFALGDIGYQGFGYSFSADQDFWFLRIGLRWDLFQGFKNRAEIQQLKVQVKRLENRFEDLRDRIRLQVINARDNLVSAHAKLEARLAGVTHAENRFRIMRNKYNQSQALLIEFLDARTNYTNARLDAAIARYNLLARQAELEQAVARY